LHGVHSPLGLSQHQNDILLHYHSLSTVILSEAKNPSFLGLKAKRDSSFRSE
jgi:hypothetical protein